jgi:hypothetical protein
VSDNIGVASVKYEYRLSTASADTHIGTVTPAAGRGKTATVTQVWNTSGLDDGTYIITVTATDVNGRAAVKTLNITRGAAPPITELLQQYREP